jgi:hypothetical protein
MLKRCAFLGLVALMAAGAFADYVETGTKEQSIKLPFCGT